MVAAPRRRQGGFRRIGGPPTRRTSVPADGERSNGRRTVVPILHPKRRPGKCAASVGGARFSTDWAVCEVGGKGFLTAGVRPGAQDTGVAAGSGRSPTRNACRRFASSAT